MKVVGTVIIFFNLFLSPTFAKTFVCSTTVAPVLTSPGTRKIVQRNAQNQGSVAITGTYPFPYTAIQARAVVVNGGNAVSWTDIVPGTSGTPFGGYLVLSPGQYNIEVRAASGNIYSQVRTVSKVGVGELFIAAGQSLMSNGGNTRNVTNDDRVEAVDMSGTWQLADDPQPAVTDGLTGGSPLPLIGNLLVSRLNMPVGFIDVAYGGSSTDSWVSTRYANALKPAIQLLGNFRAILWEQGQTDGGLGITAAAYEANINTLISNSRSDAGWVVPWGIADRSTINSGTAYPTIQGAQDFLVANTAFVFAGSNSDSIPIASGDRFDGTHFNTAGQTLQAGMWATAIENYFGW